MALLHLTAREAGPRGWKLSVGHVDHRMRPDSGVDAAFVASAAGTLGLDCRTTALDPVLPGGASIEAVLRRRRRAALRQMAADVCASHVLVGHTRDDQAETVLLNLLRGSGLRGLAGMPLRQGLWVRPLLQISRAALREWAGSAGLAWREDPTNSDPRYLRNRVRARILPLLEEEIRPGAIAALARSAEVLKAPRALVRGLARNAWPEVLRSHADGGIVLDRPKLATYHPSVVEEILRQAFRTMSGTAQGLSAVSLSAIVSASRDPGPRSFDLPRGVRASVDRAAVTLQRQSGAEPRG